MSRRDSVSRPLNGNVSFDILYSGDADSELAETISPKVSQRKISSKSSKIEEELVRQTKRLEAISRSTAALVSQISSNARDLIGQNGEQIEGWQESMGSNNDDNRDSPEKMLRCAETELIDLMKSQRALTNQKAIHLVNVYVKLDRIEGMYKNRTNRNLIRCFRMWQDLTSEKLSRDEIPDSTPVREYTSLLKNFKTPHQFSHRKIPETIQKQRVEINRLNAKLQLYRDVLSKGRLSEEEEEEKEKIQIQQSKNQFDNEDHHCSLCTQVKYFVTKDRMISGPIMEKVVECMPSPQGYMAAALLRAVFMHYVGDDDDNMLSQIQFIVFATDCELVNKRNQPSIETDVSFSRSCIEVSELWHIVFDTYRSSSTTVTTSTKTSRDTEMPAEWYVF